jgi:hypothetical protein
MSLIPPNPANAVVPLPVHSVDDMMMGGYSNYFYYCPNRACIYLATNGYGFMQQRVQTDILIGR